MKSETNDFIRNMLASRAGWLSDRISKGPENLGELVRELAATSNALADFVTVQAPSAATTDQVRGPALYKVLAGSEKTLDDLAQHLTQTSGKTHPFVSLVKQVRGIVFDPYSASRPAAPEAVNASPATV